MHLVLQECNQTFSLRSDCLDCSLCQTRAGFLSRLRRHRKSFVGTDHLGHVDTCTQNWFIVIANFHSVKVGKVGKESSQDCTNHTSILVTQRFDTNILGPDIDHQEYAHVVRHGKEANLNRCPSIRCGPILVVPSGVGLYAKCTPSTKWQMGHHLQFSLCSTWLFWCICEARSWIQSFIFLSCNFQRLHLQCSKVVLLDLGEDLLLGT